MVVMVLLVQILEIFETFFHVSKAFIIEIGLFACLMYRSGGIFDRN